MSESLRDLGEYVQEELGESVLSYAMRGAQGYEELVFALADPSEILSVLRFLRDHGQCRFQMLVDITAVDYPERPERFEVIYNLLSVKQNQRVRVVSSVAEGMAVPSVGSLFSCALWYEREVWDMFGIPFESHPDLRRILTDYGFDGHPLRKDFPLTGHVELRYDPALRRVAYAPVDLQQDFRNFDFLSPWEGMTAMQLRADADGQAVAEPEHGWRKPV